MVTVLKTLIFSVLVPGTVAIWIPYRILSSAGSRGTISIGGFRYFGLVVMTIGALIYFWCAWDFTFAGKGTAAPIDPPRELVGHGWNLDHLNRQFRSVNRAFRSATP